MIPFRSAIIMAAPAVVTVADDTDAAAYFAVLTTAPSNPERGRINALVKAAKAASLWADRDWIVPMAAESSQAGRVNLRKPSKALAATNGPAFTTNVGWTPDRVSAYLDLGELWTASGNLFSQNSHSMGVVVTAQSATSGLSALLGNVGNNPRTSLTITTTSGAGYRSADATDGPTPVSNSRIGHFSLSRIVSTQRRMFSNGAIFDEANVSSTALNTTNGQIGGSRGALCDDTLGFMYSGLGMTPAQMAQWHAIIRDNYLGPKGVMAQ